MALQAILGISCISMWVGAVVVNSIPDSKIHGANMGPTRGRQDPGGPHDGPMNFAILDGIPHWPFGDVAIFSII